MTRCSRPHSTSLAKAHTDLLFSAKLDGKKVLLYVLLEHQSRNDPRMTYRVLRYLMRIWHRHLAEFGEPLPLIIALIVSHAPGGWTSPVHFHEMISPSPASLEGVEKLVPGFTILVEDLAQVTDEELRDWALDAFPELVVRALRDGRNRDRLMRNRLETATSDLLECYAERLLVVGTLAAVFTND